jgi:hypothetical protein
MRKKTKVILAVVGGIVVLAAALIVFGMYSAGTQILSTDKKMPEELKQIKLLGINIGKDYVTYVWLGGMERTDLEVKRTENGTFTITATYNEEESRVLWPKN